MPADDQAGFRQAAEMRLRADSSGEKAGEPGERLRRHAALRQGLKTHPFAPCQPVSTKLHLSSLTRRERSAWLVPRAKATRPLLNLRQAVSAAGLVGQSCSFGRVAGRSLSPQRPFAWPARPGMW